MSSIEYEKDHSKAGSIPDFMRVFKATAPLLTDV